MLRTGQFAIMSVVVLGLCTGPAHAEDARFDQPMQFSWAGNGGNCNGCQWIDATGVIEADTPKGLQQFVDEEKANGNFVGVTVILNSPGGNLAAGLKLGEMLRKFGMTTEVGETYPDPYGHFQLRAGLCASACAYAFLGGIDRSLRAGSRLGFHQFRDIGKQDLGISSDSVAATGLSQGQVVMGVLVAYVVEMGVDARVLTIASAAAPQEMGFLNGDQLVQYHVVTIYGFGEWQMNASGIGLVAFAENQEASSLEPVVSMFCAGPANAPYAMIQLVREPGKPLTIEDFIAAISDIELTVDDQKMTLASDKEQLRRTLSMSSDSSAYYLYVALPPDDAERLVAAKSFALSLNSYHAFYNWGPGVRAILDDTARKEIRLAFRNCVKH